MTESNEKQQNGQEQKLTERQLKAIPLIVTSATYTEACKKAGLNRTTLYEWLKIPEFKVELDRQRDEVTSEAFGVLSQSLTKAVETLVGLLDHKDDRLKRLTAKDIIEHFLKYKELRELEERIEAIEQTLERQRP
ncbi:MAG TPA: phBC6A51 family helix-turn-helix protein [Sedimentisphaerales bacterium]|nr:phBC6A51 family helix-turn-helix protein [Sedimentisphaerales bacterium]